MFNPVEGQSAFGWHHQVAPGWIPAHATAALPGIDGVGHHGAVVEVWDEQRQCHVEVCVLVDEEKSKSQFAFLLDAAGLQFSARLMKSSKPTPYLRKSTYFPETYSSFQPVGDLSYTERNQNSSRYFERF